MPFQAVPNTAEVSVHFTNGFAPVVNTIGALFPTAYSQADLAGLSSVIDGWVGSDLLPLMHQDYDYIETTARGLAFAIDFAATTNTSAGSGALTGAGTNAQVAVVATKLTGRTGRSARGRWYQAGLAASQILDVAHCTTAYVTALNAAMANLITAIASAGATPVVVSRYTAGAPRPTGTVQAITSIIVRDQRLDTQRRRLGQ